MGDERAQKVSLLLGCSALAVSVTSAAGLWLRRRRLLDDAVCTEILELGTCTMNPVRVKACMASSGSGPITPCSRS